MLIFGGCAIRWKVFDEIRFLDLSVKYDAGDHRPTSLPGWKTLIQDD